uniref:Uncharacterized protein n=1 Tax=Amphimedon queenslandica TaxID=400682 RepID=A0A1X7TT14_AMPQE
MQVYYENHDESLAKSRKYRTQNKQKVSDYLTKYQASHHKERLKAFKNIIANREERLDAAKDNFIANREETLEASKDNYIANGEERLQAFKDIYIANRQETLEGFKDNFASNNEQRKKYEWVLCLSQSANKR